MSRQLSLLSKKLSYKKKAKENKLLITTSTTTALTLCDSYLNGEMRNRNVLLVNGRCIN